MEHKVLYIWWAVSFPLRFLLALWGASLPAAAYPGNWIAIIYGTATGTGYFYYVFYKWLSSKTEVRR